MVQESTMICVDNSEWMRNGDFTPTRLQCQQEAANLIMQCKLRANPENAVGILSMADTVEVLSTMTQENGKLFMKLHQIEPKGESNFVNGIKVAHLALKHRQNRNHKMRIVLFVGSPIEHLDAAELTKLAKKLKKEKVLVDVICFGEADSENSEIMGQFIETLNGREGNGGSNMVVVSSGCTLTEALLSSPICRGEDGAAAPVVAAGGGGFEFGIDPEDDPDLALALRVSLEEQRQRQQQEAAAAGGNAETTHEPMDTAAQDVMTMDPGSMTEEQQLEWALRMSMQEGAANAEQSTTAASVAATVPATADEGTAIAAAPTSDVPTSDLMEVDATAATARQQPSAAAEDDQLGQLMSDPELLRQLVADLPGVDPNSQEIQDAVNSAAEQAQKESQKHDEKSK
uniref:26S proteasome non-ATPase regulatory subunit 4 n=2 Tax=Parascaris univalens TaxID=6257 RepID=A0A915CID6_PARUN